MTNIIEVPATRILLRALIFPFIVLAGYFVAWGAVFCADAFTRWVFGNLTGPIGWIPWAGKVINKPILSLSNKLTRYLGGQEAHFDRQMGIRWHSFAALMEQRNDNAVRGAIVLYHLGHRLLVFWGNSATGGLMKEHAKAAKHAGAQATAATKTANHAEKVAHGAAVATAGATVIPHPRIGAPSRSYPAGRIGSRVAGLEGEVGHILDWTIPGLRARDKALSDSLGKLWHRVRSERRTIGIGAFTALLVMALGRLGLGRLPCLNRKNALRTVCRMNPSLLESILADTLLIAGTLSLEQFAREMIGVTESAVQPITTFWRAS